MVKTRAMRTLENALRRWGFCRIAGCDEVGRGCLAGPVVAADLYVPPIPPPVDNGLGGSFYLRASIGANATVVRDVEPYAVVAASPGRVVAKRDPSDARM